MYYEEWLRLGERLQLSGKDLERFIQQKEDEFIAREERAKKREDEKRMLEMQHEFQMKEQELKIQELKSKNHEKETTTGRSLRPKLPKFDEVQDDMDAYIERFERFARGQNWSMDTWATSLSSLLTGNGLEVYTSMPPAEANHYTALKVALLKRYQLTEEGFRTKFRCSKPENGETVFQFVARLRRYLSRWTEMAGTDGTQESLADLLLREQFIQSCSTDTAIFLKERAPTSIAEATRLAEQYAEAHGGKYSSNRGKPVESPEDEGDGTIPMKQIQKPSQSGGKTCFLCGRQGHFARECRQRQSHTRNDMKIGAVCTRAEMLEEPVATNTVERRLKLENGEYLPLVCGGCTIETLDGVRNLDIKKGFIGTKEVKVLRDTGCELAAVRKELVDDDQLQEKNLIMVTIDGEAKVVPTAKIHVDTPYYVGELEVMVPKALICDLVIGNVPGVTDKPNLDWGEEKELKNGESCRHEKEMADLTEEHNKEMTELEPTNEQKLMIEYNEFQEQQAKMMKMQEEYAHIIFRMKGDKQRALQELTEYYENKIQEMTTNSEHKNSKTRKWNREFWETKKQIEEDADHELVDFMSKHERWLRNQKEVPMRLKGEVGIMKKKFPSLQKEVDYNIEEIEKYHDIEEDHPMKTESELDRRNVQLELNTTEPHQELEATDKENRAADFLSKEGRDKTIEAERGDKKIEDKQRNHRQ